MKFYVAAILAIAFLENFKVHIIRETVGSQTMALSSCVDLRPTEINIRRISGYEKQNTPVKAVIFITKTGVKVCVPHNLPWVKRTINKLDQKKARKQTRTTVSSRAANLQQINSSAV